MEDSEGIRDADRLWLDAMTEAQIIPFKGPKDPKCDFCGERPKEGHLIGESGSAHICFACVKICNQRLKEAEENAITD